MTRRQELEKLAKEDYDKFFKEVCKDIGESMDRSNKKLDKMLEDKK